MSVTSTFGWLAVNRRLDVRLERRHALERQGARDVQAEIADHFGAAAPQADEVGSGDARHLFDREPQRLRHPLRRRVDQSVDGAAAEPEAGDADEQRDAGRGQGVGVRQAGAGRREADEDQGRGDQVAGEVQRIGGERVAAGAGGDDRQSAPAHEVDDDRDDDRAEGEDVGVDGLRFAADPAQRRESDRRGEHEQETGLEKRHHRLDLGVAEMVVFVGRFVRFAHGVIGQAARSDVEAVVRRLGEQGERAGHRPRGEFHQRHQRRSPPPRRAPCGASGARRR